jgi:hypothetical protein
MISRFRLAAAVAVMASLCISALRSEAATLAVTVNSTNTLTAPFLPAARIGTQLTNSAAWSESRTVLGIPTWIEGYDVIAPAANINLDWLLGRTKLVTLLENTTVNFLNTPIGGTNIQRMIVEVAGDAVQSVTFTGVSWQTDQVTVPAAFVITRYEIEAIGGVLTGYVISGGSGGGGGAVQVFNGYYSEALPTDVPTTTAALAYDLDSPHTLYMWDGTIWY